MADDSTPRGALDRVLTVEVMRVTERAAVSAARLRGRGDERAADHAAVEAMRRELNRLNIEGIVVIGEGERDEAPMLFIGEAVGTGAGQRVDIALDPLEGTTLCAKDMPNSLATLALASGGSLLHAPDVYMDKVAIGPGFPPGLIELDMPPAEMIGRLAKEKGVTKEDITACILDRPRHADLIAAVRDTGAAIRLISDGDVAGIIHTTTPMETGIDIYIGIGGAPEGVLAAAALRCVGGQMQGRLVLKTDEHRARAERMGITDFDRVYTHEEMARGDVYFSATGVTDGNLLEGVRFFPGYITTETIVMRSLHGTVRRIKARHTNFTKFLLE